MCNCLLTQFVNGLPLASAVYAMYCSTISAHHHNIIIGALNLVLSYELSLPGRDLHGGVQQELCMHCVQFQTGCITAASSWISDALQ